VTNEELSIDDLVELKSARVVRPRPPTLTSIPSLLSVFQNEWDSLALETYTLRQHLTQTRQELSHALYENDAARRVIARLSKERDEARQALSKITVNGAATSNGDAMQVDEQDLSPTLVAKVEATQEKCARPPPPAWKDCVEDAYIMSRLSKTRRKRPVPEDWASADAIQSFKPSAKSKPHHEGPRNVALDADGDLALFGGDDGIADVFSISQNQVVQELAAGAPVTVAMWARDTAILSTSAGTVKGYKGDSETLSFSEHRGEITGMALHPSGDILASVGSDKSYIFYDLSTSTKALQIYTDSRKEPSEILKMMS